MQFPARRSIQFGTRPTHEWHWLGPEAQSMQIEWRRLLPSDSLLWVQNIIRAKATMTGKMNQSESDTEDLTNKHSRTAEMRRTLWIRRHAVSITKLTAARAAFPARKKPKIVPSAAFTDIGGPPQNVRRVRE